MPPLVLHVTGARPNFPKAAPVIRALERARASAQRLVHTGQHYDEQMSRRVLPRARPARARRQPRGRLGHPRRSRPAAVMVGLEDAVPRAPAADVVVVYGDVNSTVAAALVAAKLHDPARATSRRGCAAST